MGKVTSCYVYDVQYVSHELPLRARQIFGKFCRTTRETCARRLLWLHDWSLSLLLACHFSSDFLARLIVFPALYLRTTVFSDTGSLLAAAEPIQIPAGFLVHGLNIDSRFCIPPLCLVA